MTRPPAVDNDWDARVVQAGVRVDLWDNDRDDFDFALLSDTILRASSESRLSDDDLYPLLVRLWVGGWPQVDWPPAAPALTRRCATALAAKGSSVMDAMLRAPTTQALTAAREAIIAELDLTEGMLLSALADRWEQLADAELPIDSGRTLLAFARNVLLEPTVGACAMLWSTLESTPGTVTCAAAIAWDDWSPIDIDDWSGVVASEIARLGLPVQPMPADGDVVAGFLASARASVLRANGGLSAIAESLVRTSCWPGDTALIDPLASRALKLAMQHVDAIDPETDNDDICDSIQLRLIPPDAALKLWVRDPSFGSLSDHTGSARTGVELLHEIVGWLTWSLARDAVDIAGVMGRVSSPDA